jgi:formylglycine-generating enzyme required for sulfatase activity
MAPEQWRCSSAVDARADQYGLGCTLFYLLIGRAPFAGDNSHTPFDKMQLHLNEPPPPVRALRPEVPPLLERVIERLLAKDPAERFADMTEVAKHLEQLVAGQKPALLPPRPRAPRSPRRLSPPILGLLAVTGFAVGLIGCLRDTTPTTPSESQGTLTAKGPPAIKPAPMPGHLPMTADEAVLLQRAWAEHLSRPIVEPHPVGMRFVLIPPGAYHVSDRTKVVITAPFQIAETEVTVAQFRAFVADRKYRTLADQQGSGLILKGLKPGARDQVAGINWANPGYPDHQDDHPVVQMAWDDAVAFCDWLSKQDGMRYRLPTEWEWTWACRAGMARQHQFDEGELAEYAWYLDNAEVRPHQVGLRRANRWGLYDMLGNVHEWATNNYQTKPLSDGTILDPPGDTTNRLKSVCGGGFESRQPQPISREGFFSNTAYVKIGFRVLREVSPH